MGEEDQTLERTGNEANTVSKKLVAVSFGEKTTLATSPALTQSGQVEKMLERAEKSAKAVSAGQSMHDTMGVKMDSAEPKSDSGVRRELSSEKPGKIARALRAEQVVHESWGEKTICVGGPTKKAEKFPITSRESQEVQVMTGEKTIEASQRSPSPSKSRM